MDYLLITVTNVIILNERENPQFLTENLPEEIACHLVL